MFTSDTGFKPYWFIGIVVDKNDQMNQGRVKVRVLGIHPEDPRISVSRSDKEEKDYVEDQDLPWAQVINGTYGKMNFMPDEGEWVMGFFADGRDAQVPFIMGSIPGMNIDTFNFGAEFSNDEVANGGVTTPNREPVAQYYPSPYGALSLEELNEIESVIQNQMSDSGAPGYLQFAPGIARCGLAPDGYPGCGWKEVRFDIWKRIMTVSKRMQKELRVNSAYRTPLYNQSVGGTARSIHMSGRALDISMTGLTDDDIRNFIVFASQEGFSTIQCYNSFIHVDTEGARRWRDSGRFENFVNAAYRGEFRNGASGINSI